MNLPSIRFACYSDLEDVRNLYQELRPHDLELSAFEADMKWREILDQSNIRIIVAEVNQVLVSTCMIALVSNFASGGRPFALIEHVVTLPPFRGRGLARAVLKYALDFAWSHNAYKVMLMSGMDRTEAHKLYESLGFCGDVERGFAIKASV